MVFATAAAVVVMLTAGPFGVALKENVDNVGAGLGKT